MAFPRILACLFVKRAAVIVGTALLGAFPANQTAGDSAAEESKVSAEELGQRKRVYLRRLLYKRADLDDWLAAKAFPFAKYDPGLGYLHLDRDFKEGMDGAICSYRYDRLGARRTIAHADRPCRINTYGDSFTSCEQVSDGETWQEVLAAHLGEPIRNYGIGGYSVYLAYLRMQREEKRSGAEYIILNIFDDDHYRNLLSWQRMRFGINRISTQPPTPHVRVDADARTFVEHPNPCPTAADLYKLCDLDNAVAIFQDHYMLNRYVLRELDRERKVAGTPASDFDDRELTRQALYASMRIVDKVEEFAAREKKKVLYVLSYNPETVRRRLKGSSRFDQAFVDFLDQRRLPYVDLLEAHATDYAKFAPDINGYVSRYFIGHYNPLGNHFCAFAIKDKLVRMLHPPPPAYARPR
jgi:hypothetical protein